MSLPFSTIEQLKADCQLLAAKQTVIRLVINSTHENDKELILSSLDMLFRLMPSYEVEDGNTITS
jgi:hypothetical protein